MDELRELVTLAQERRFPDSELLGALLAAVAEAEKCAAVGAHLAAKKVRTRSVLLLLPKNKYVQPYCLLRLPAIYTLRLKKTCTFSASLLMLFEYDFTRNASSTHKIILLEFRSI